MIFQNSDYTLGDFIRALRWVESGNQPNGGEGAVGDGGKALGPLQIWEVCYQDSGVSFPYEKVKKLRYSIRVAVNYWLRYCPDPLLEGDWETMARIWNGGPDGNLEVSTLGYWGRVRDRMLLDLEETMKREREIK